MAETNASDFDLAVSILETDFPDNNPQGGENSSSSEDGGDSSKPSNASSGGRSTGNQPSPMHASSASAKTNTGQTVASQMPPITSNSKVDKFLTHEKLDDGSEINAASSSSPAETPSAALSRSMPRAFSNRASRLKKKDQMDPIILSKSGWASNHPGLLELVQKYEKEFDEECGDNFDVKKSITVNKIIMELEKYKPKLLLETSEEPLNHTRLSHQDIVVGGRYHKMMAKKVMECFERIHLAKDKDTLMLDSPPPKPFSVPHSPQSAEGSLTGSVKRQLPTTKEARKQTMLTPVRVGMKHDLSAEKTPLAGNKKLRQQLLDVVMPRSSSRAASRQAKKLLEVLPTSSRRYVRVDQLTYDWSSLEIDGAAAWNRFLRESHDPRIELHPPVVSGIDAYQLVQSLKTGLATTTPPPSSFLYDALSEDFDPEEEADTPQSRLMGLFRNMADYETSEFSKRKHSYHLMKADELRDYLVGIEKDFVELDEIESQLDGDKVAVEPQDPGRLNKTDGTEALTNAPVFWQKDFAALCVNKGPATRFLMAQDQY